MNAEDHNALILRGARVIDASVGRDEVADLFIECGKITDTAPPQAAVVDLPGCIVCPGLVDLHVHLREPGQTHKETIKTGLAAAAAGGFTFVACMPNTQPPIDNEDTVRWVLQKAREAGSCTLGPIAAITRGRSGRELTDFEALLKAGAVAFSDDGDGVEDDRVMRAAFELAKKTGAVLIQHCDYRDMSSGGVIHLGEVSRRLQVAGIDPCSEEAMIERDISLSRETGGRYHVAHISTSRAVELVRKAKAEGVPITAEVCPHHLALTEDACVAGNANNKMNPPLRPRADVEACRRGLVDGTIDCIATDHAPHTAEEKQAGLLRAPPGVVGLETALSVAARVMVESGLADWPDLVRWLSIAPASVLGLRRSTLQLGELADLTVFDPNVEWTVDPNRFVSMGRNTPFGGWTLPARVIGTFHNRVFHYRTHL